MSVGTIAKIVLLLLQLTETLTSWLQQQKYIDEGYDKALGEQALKIANRSDHAKKVMETVSDLSNSDVDKQLSDLEPQTTNN